jgi:predicted TIM-barrel fold metal-dependent hydrolase
MLPAIAKQEVYTMQKIFDFHTHPFWDDASNICNHKDIIKMAKEDMRPMFEKMGVVGIAGSVILLGDALPLWERIVACNDLALKLREYLGDFYYPGVHIHPAYIPESVAQIRRFAEQGFHLVGELVPYMHGWSDYSCAEYSYLLDVCREYDMVVNMHSIDDDAMDKMVAAHKDVKIVMAHPGEYSSYLRHLRRMDISENYWLDLSGTGLFRHGMLARGIAQYGAERFLFGSDYPTCNPAMFIGGVTLDELISLEDKEKILYTNAKKLLNL